MIIRLKGPPAFAIRPWHWRQEYLLIWFKSNLADGWIKAARGVAASNCVVPGPRAQIYFFSGYRRPFNSSRGLFIIPCVIWHSGTLAPPCHFDDFRSALSHEVVQSSSSLLRDLALPQGAQAVAMHAVVTVVRCANISCLTGGNSVLVLNHPAQCDRAEDDLLEKPC